MMKTRIEKLERNRPRERRRHVMLTLPDDVAARFDAAKAAGHFRDLSDCDIRTILRARAEAIRGGDDGRK